MKNRIKLQGKILFDPKDYTNKHKKQSSWKKVVIAKILGDYSEYYAWFIKKRFNLELNKPLRGAHITLINDSLRDIGENIKNWDNFKDMWDGKIIDIYLDVSPKNDYTNCGRRFKLTDAPVNQKMTITNIDKEISEKYSLVEGQEIIKRKGEYDNNDFRKVEVSRIKGHWWLSVPYDRRDDINAFRAQIGLGKPYFGPHMTIGHVNEKNFEHYKYIAKAIKRYKL